MTWPHRASGHSTFNVGQPPQPSDYERLIARAPMVASEIPEALLPIIRPAAALLFLAPAVMWLAHFIVLNLSSDAMIAGRVDIPIYTALAAMALSASQATGRSMRWIFVRRLVAWLALMATLGIAIFYVYLAATDRRDAVRGPVERAFAGMANGKAIHQRADGSFVERGRAEPWSAGFCSDVQKIVGQHGFVWIRTVASQPGPQAGGLSWPMRREECFGGVPLGSSR